ncbi:MAG: helix-turn-helix transcriptional regulator, partial [Bacteroidales bacterium]|nr:helix-turn-helix transcriptional regulator [Bacteroidales bacterium]
VALGIAIFLYVRHLIQRQRSVAKQEISAVKIDMLTHHASQLDQEFIRNVMDYLTEHLSDGDLQVNDVADAMNMSRATFYRRLKQAADLSPNDFIHQVRMRQAAERLVTTNDPVSTIAYSVGFNNPKYFSKCFRQDYDMSPLEYRQQARAKAETQAADEE